MSLSTPHSSTEFTSSPSEGRQRSFQMPVFKPGARVMQAGREETVSHIVLRRQEMMVYLVGHEEPVKPSRLSLQPMMFTTERRPEALHWYL